MRTPEVHRFEHGRGRLAQQLRQPLRALGAEALSAAERHAAGALGPRAAHHLHGPVGVHLPTGTCSMSAGGLPHAGDGLIQGNRRTDMPADSAEGSKGSMKHLKRYPRS